MTIVIQRPTNKLFSLNDGLPTVFPIKCLKKLSAILFPSLFLASVNFGIGKIPIMQLQLKKPKTKLEWLVVVYHHWF